MVNEPDQFEQESLSAGQSELPDAGVDTDAYREQLLDAVRNHTEDGESFSAAQTEVQKPLEFDEGESMTAASTELAVPTQAAALQNDIDFGRTMESRGSWIGATNNAVSTSSADITSAENYNAALLGSVAVPGIAGGVAAGASVVGGGILAASGEAAAGTAVAAGGTTLSALATAASVAPVAIGAGVGALIDKKNRARGAVIGGAGSSIATTLALGGGVTGALSTGGGLLLAGGAGLLANRVGNIAGRVLGAPKGGAFKNTIVRGFGLPFYVPYRMAKNVLSGGIGNIFGKKNR